MEKMNLLYLGEPFLDSYVVWCLRESNKFGRIDHLIKSTLDVVHVSMSQLPDKIILKCDYLDGELEWTKRYALDIPRIFITCFYCEEKIPTYKKLGNIFHIDKAFLNKDLLLETLVSSVLEGTNYEF